MRPWLQLHIRKIGLGLIVLAVVGAGAFGVYAMRSETQMPPDKRAYWGWVSSINRNAEAALTPGLALLSKHPDLPPLYLRLAKLCLEIKTVDTCRDALINVESPSSLSRLYREAALTLLEQDAAITPWQQLARAPELDPTLARLIVDETWPEAVKTVEAIWKHQFSTDSAAVGAAFGLGYAAVLRSDWETGKQMLNRATELEPNDPQAYRELGRIYFHTGKVDELMVVLDAGIAASLARHNLEQELIHRGNLGWTIFQRTGDLNKAEKLILEALDRSRQLSDKASEGYSLYRLANIYYQQNRFAEAVPLVRTADALYAENAPNQYAEVVVFHGALLSSMYRFSDAERVLENAIAEAEKSRYVTMKVQALVALAGLRYKMGRYSAVREVGREALAIVEQYQLIDQEIVTRLILGDAEREGGNFDEATAHFQRVVELAQETQSAAHLSEGFYRLGQTAMLLRDFNTARVYFEEMIKQVEETGQARRLAEAYLGLGRTYIQFGQVQEALRYYNLALALDNVGVIVQANLLIAKAWTLLDLGRFEEAEALFREATRANPASLSASYRVELGLGNTAFSRHDCATALQHFRRAETINREVPIPAIHWFALFGKALTQWCLGDLTRAEAAFNESIDIIEAFREDLSSSTNRAYFVQDKVSVYEYFAAFLEEQGRSQEAFHFAERARSRSLVDLLYTSQREQRPDMDREADKAVELDRRLKAISQKISVDVLDEDSSAYLAVRSAQLRREYERSDSMYRQVQAALAQERPIYTFNPVPEDLARAMLEEGEAMVLYDLRRLGVRGAEEEASVAYVVTPDQVIKTELSLQSDSLTRTIRAFRERLGSTEAGPGEGWGPMARQLYQDLMAPVVDVLPPSAKHLHIVPEGILYYLPFATLQDSQGRFLIEQYTLSVTPSASTLKLSRERNPRRWDSMLLLADPDRSLPGARKEVAAIASTGASEQRYALVGEEATQENLLEVAGQFDILHFATHGRFVFNAPWRSHLELFGGEELNVDEISQMDLNAYLVTLSACETGLSGGLISEIPSGDEWVGLNQAFLAAGTPTVMASLWPINDRVSSDFMIAFYQALGPGGKAQALADVQRQFIRNARTRHPFYWAPFTIMGDPL